ncbi:unnamed protein product [Thelazia callipaeda]|uniref:non-specific serine/threonine protein kinase n=1 Tax=Thelazia callipaeda TaxID=103827 RepID=A0A0N5CR75_THECL|nr:unnamed protein product [Thelazia callipaeda]
MDDLQDTGQIGVKTLINDVYRSQSAESTPRHLFPTLYVGESIFGLFAMPAFVDSRTVTVIPNYIGPPLLEGPSVAAVNRGLEPAIISSARSGALIDLHLGERNQEVVNREFLALGYHEPPQLARSEFVVPHKFDHHKRYRSLSFVTADIQSHEFTVETSKINYYKEPGSYSLWKTNKVEIIIAALSTVIIFSVSCWFCMQKLRNHRKGKLLAQRASYAQTSKSHSSIWYARQNQELADGWLQAGKITYNPYDRLGYGCEGTVVFRGKFDGREVAVKRVIADIQLADREVDLLRESDVHPNVIRYFCMECDSNFRYIALELCDYSLYDYVDSAEIRKCCPLSAMEILLQATEGLAYLHTINIVHRDMKPQNVLISKSTMQNTIRALISDFGLCKRLKAGRNSLSRRSGVMGTDGWVAPEALMSDTSITCAVDVFSLGCIYYYVLANGTHPFGDPLKRQANIIQGDYNLDSLDVNSSVNLLAIELIELMIRADPLLRPTSAALVVHPFFWSRGRQLQFFMDVSDRIEKLGDNDILLRRLEKNARSVIGVNWRHNICATLSLGSSFSSEIFVLKNVFIRVYNDQKQNKRH